jgi:hypothetical protein
VICADIKEVKTKNWKGSAKQEEETSLSPARHLQTSNQPTHKRDNCKNWVHSSSSPS